MSQRARQPIIMDGGPLINLTLESFGKVSQNIINYLTNSTFNKFYFLGDQIFIFGAQYDEKYFLIGISFLPKSE